jgi:hypothetical protein
MKYTWHLITKIRCWGDEIMASWRNLKILQFNFQNFVMHVWGGESAWCIRTIWLIKGLWTHEVNLGNKNHWIYKCIMLSLGTWKRTKKTPVALVLCTISRGGGGEGGALLPTLTSGRTVPQLKNQECRRLGELGSKRLDDGRLGRWWQTQKSGRSAHMKIGENAVIYTWALAS